MTNPDENRVDVEYGSPSMKAKPLQPQWKNPPTVNKLKQDIREAEPDFQEHISNVNDWLDIRDAKLKVKIPKGKSKVSPKVVRKQNEWRYSTLSEPFLSSEDMFDVVPETHEDVDAARDNAIVINKQFDKDIDRVKFIDEYVRTAVDEGTVVVRVGWDYEEETRIYYDPIIEMVYPPEIEAQLNQAAEAVKAGQLDPMQFKQMVIQAEQMKVEKQTDQFEKKYDTRVVSNKPTVEVCEYDKIMIDPTCNGDMDKAEFVVYQFYSSKSELSEDGKYSNIDAINMEEINNSLSASDDDIINGSFRFQDEPRKKLLVTEYWGNWDIHGNGTTISIVATFVGNTMIRLEENPFPDRKPPFVKVNYLPKRNDVYGGEPDAVLIEDNQDVIAALTRGMLDLMGRSANAQQGISADALDPAQKLRFEQGRDFIFNPGIDPSKAFWMATYPEIPRSAMELVAAQKRDAEELTASVPFGTGSEVTLGKTATAARNAADATAKRELGILRRLSNGIVEIGKKIMAMNAVNLDDEEIIRLTDGEFVSINRENLAGDFDLNLSVSTPEVDNEQAQDLGFMLQTIGPNMDPGLQAKILGKIARLKKMPGLAHDIETYQPQPDPMEQKVKELQIQLLEAQVANERAKGTENQADTELKTAKTQTELAKARALDSTADMTDLDFVQKQNGTKELREEAMKSNDFKRDLLSNEQQHRNSVKEKTVEAAIDPNNPLVGGYDSRQASGGSSNTKKKLKPKVFNANNHYQKTPENILPGMDTPEENLMDEMVNRRF